MPAQSRPPQPSGDDRELAVLSRWFCWRDAANLLREHLNDEACGLLRQRAERIAALESAEDWRRRQGEVRRTLEQLLGPLPERTPLHPQVLGVVQREGYRVEKIVFESRPGFFVTGCLFLPEGVRAPVPAILNPIGHTDISFRAESYQRLILNLVRKGFVVFPIDPAGQGERLQYFDPEAGKSRIGGSTREHSYFGRQCFLTGHSPGHYFAWDGIRAIDYLLTRTEVDPARIGVTGISGGGTQTAYIAALDERVAAAAPACYITSFRRLLESIGPQDAEQNLFRGIESGIDHADFLEVRAPRPALVVATTGDFFSIQGARETFAEVQRAYTALGAPSAIQLVEDDHGHGYTPRTREAIYAFFQEALSLPGSSQDEAIEPLSPADLTVTRTGQIATSLGGESVFSLNRAHASALLGELSTRRRDTREHLPAVRASARRLSGFRPPSAAPEAIFVGRLQRSDTSIEQVVLPGEGACVVPALVLRPTGSGPFPGVVYLHPDGKAAAATDGSAASAMARRGRVVLLPDLSGIGELAPAGREVGFEPVLLGRSLPGIRAGEIVRAVHYLLSRDDVQRNGVRAAAWGVLGPALLHAAAFDDAIAAVALLEAPLSWQGMALNPYYETDFSAVVPGALAAYDLPDLAACLTPRPMLLVNPLDHQNRPVSPDTAAVEWEIVRQAYGGAGAGERLAIRVGADSAELGAVLERWLR